MVSAQFPGMKKGSRRSVEVLVTESKGELLLNMESPWGEDRKKKQLRRTEH